MANSLGPTYGVWFVSLFVETILYGIGLLQGWIYFAGRPGDGRSIKSTVMVVLFLETVQVVFFFRSSYSRFVEMFGELQTNLIWEDSLQLLASYLSAFTVQIFFASRIYQLTKGRGRLSLAAIGIYTILALALVQISAGIAQTILSYKLRSYLKLGETKAITTLQTAASLACDVLITVYLCIFLESQKGELMRTNTMVDTLIYHAINRGVLTTLSSGATMVLFLVLPDTFWFFVGLAPSSKLYMNSMLATLNARQYIRDKMQSSDKGWNSIPLSTIPTTQGPRKNPSALDFETNSLDINAKPAEFPACA
ncbi:hypothetical protein B0H15DRAFT_872068 [Mycena belliarum]|uniref:DUF6534 domain-containing protein n=1 Tax=Mycena belliarum TaxID=1033014 RepID=A0AAD6TNJ3_9AGAR|nr:hypothetical protein B0H15DRAFT_872068 [Mycena belliae]